jgi:hypothetical protein
LLFVIAIRYGKKDFMDCEGKVATFFAIYRISQLWGDKAPSEEALCFGAFYRTPKLTPM